MVKRKTCSAIHRKNMYNCHTISGSKKLTIILLFVLRNFVVVHIVSILFVI